MGIKYSLRVKFQVKQRAKREFISQNLYGNKVVPMSINVLTFCEIKEARLPQSLFLVLTNGNYDIHGSF